MIWEQLGFTKSPYFWEELSVSQEGYSLFVGRHTEGRRFIINVAEPEGCTIVVDGRSGVGKTSFVNYNQYVLFNQIDSAYPDLSFRKPHLLPSLRKIQLREGESVDSIYLKVVSGTIFSIQSVCRQNGWDFPKSLEEVRDYVTQIVTHSETGGFGVTVLGFGASRTTGKGQTIPPTQFREITFLEILDQIAETVRREFHLDGIIVPLNNLDILSPSYLVSTLDYLRDSLFSRRYYWWVLLGPQGLFSTIRQSIPRLAGVVSGGPIDLAPLSLEELEELVEARVQSLAISNAAPAAPPVSMRIILYLYEKSDGDIRFAFQVANDIVRRVFYDYPSISQIDEELAARQIVQITVDELDRSKFNPAEVEIMKRVIAEPELKEISLASFASFVESLAPEDIRVALEALVQKRFLSRSTVPDCEPVYLPRGYTSLAQSLRLRDYKNIWAVLKA